MIFWDLGLTLFDVPKDVAFAEILVLRNIFGFSVVNWAPKWNKFVWLCWRTQSLQFCYILGPSWSSIWVKIQNFEGFFKHCVFLIGTLHLVKISARLNNIWGSKGPKLPRKGHFMNVESIRKTLKIFNFTTTNAILMKLTTDIYLNKVFHLTKSWGVTHRM